MTGYFDDLNHLYELFPFIVCFVAFFLGSLPFSNMLNRILKGNTFKANVKTHAGAEPKDYRLWSATTVAVILDISKGVVATFLATSSGCQFIFILLGINDPSTVSFQLSTVTIWFVGFCTLLGHCFSPWQNFQGGKGVAPLLGVLLVLSPLSAVFGAGGFLLSFFNKRILSMASIVGLLVASIAYLVTNPIQIQVWVGGAMVLLILIRHEDNIDALLEKREKPFR